MKKAQVEIIGLMLIIILLTILAVIFLRLTLKPSTTTSEARQSIIASATIDSIVKTSYNDKTFENLIFDCFEGSNCNILEQEITKIMQKLMPNKKFFLIFSSEKQNFLELGQNCLGIQANNPYVIKSIPIKISLKLC